MPRLSLFFKLTALALTAAIATILIFLLLGKLLFQDAREHHAHRIGHMTKLAVQAIIQDPTPATLTQISRELGVGIRYADDTHRFATDANMPAFSQTTPARMRSWRRRQLPPEISFVRADDDFYDDFYLLYDNGRQRALISLENKDNRTLLPVLALGAAATLLLWGGFYLLIRRQLSPLTALRRDMEAVGDGEWRQCAVNRRDEIGLLAQGFNDMQERLKALLAARKRFLIAASHELRSPIARLKLAVEMIEDDKTKAAVRNDLAELETLTGDILQNARLQSTHPGIKLQPQQAADLLKQIIAARPASDQARIRTHIAAGGDIAINVDSALITRAINNLLDNALKYAAHADITLASEGEQAHRVVAITVADDGDGVAEQDLPLLFEPFFRADDSRTRASGGFGLGLALVAAAAEAHNGSVSAANRQPHGLGITITLPLARQRR